MQRFALRFLFTSLLVLAPVARLTAQVTAPIAPAPAAPVPAAPTAAGPAAADSTNLFDLGNIERIVGQDIAKAIDSIQFVWNLVIIAGPDAKHPLMTVGTLAAGIVLLGLAYVAAGMISRWTAARISARFRLNKSGIAPVQSLTFYVLLAMFSMLSLNILHVPITAFSFLGGAVAIGAGFGSQNVINNFISGLILLVERPIRVADVIELDGQIGTVTHIGARSTKIVTSGNREMIVPNSKLLETSVINWTLSDDVGGCVVKVGAAYGSPTREVERLLKQAALAHPRVLKEPAPEVAFADFGADSLNFELRFRVNLRETRKVDVESDLRYAIDDLFNGRGIVMAYPQRDVHLNILRPVEVRLTDSLRTAKAA